MLTLFNIFCAREIARVIVFVNMPLQIFPLRLQVCGLECPIVVLPAAASATVTVPRWTSKMSEVATWLLQTITFLPEGSARFAGVATPRWHLRQLLLFGRQLKLIFAVYDVPVKT